MNNYSGICLVFCFAIFGLGSAIRCVKCKDYTGSCTKTQDCTYDDACLTLTERGGQTYRQCVKYSDCDYNRLAQMFPAVPNFNFNCCTGDLCNGATSIGTGKPLLGLLASLAVMWWCMH
ncbi:CD59 glycoprotein [Salmo salar]|uniref:MAC-inhibitory protein n=1 Tax=Salmo salar TaxID=8030 RepID=B5X604_SALSA|nr:CD59 glycoprotein [Salmo salar]XP_014030640.1 CD59 glycoprotein [Salmo salar]XP_014030641.1 CD59 glycoprotein [Salmo salar]ACI66274.1 CD59 glycoprotein precursor [Salmo salar]AGH92522.1 cd59 glycoprotein precursor [Salmo salar]|eukprot:XP_014030639.1 PREDICTED: CD59 glycoprotein-like [Salmo salar]